MSARDEAAEEPARPAPTTITSYFRLLAGLTSLMSTLCLRHLSASGPAGILESSVAMTCAARGWKGIVKVEKLAAQRGAETDIAATPAARGCSRPSSTEAGMVRLKKKYATAKSTVNFLSPPDQRVERSPSVWNMLSKPCSR